MRNMNKILILFLFVIMISFLAIWEFVQSEKFANVLSKSVTEFTKIKLKSDIKFEKLEFAIFPPGAVVKNVQFTMPLDDKKINFNVRRLGIYFDLLDSFQTQLTIKEILLDDGKLDVSNLNENKVVKTAKDKEVDDIIIDKQISRILNVVNNEIPVKVRNLKLVDVAVDIFDNKFFATDSSLSFNKNQFFVDINLQKIEMLQPYLKGKQIDSARLNLIVSESIIRIQKINLKRKMASFEVDGIVKNIRSLKSSEYDLNINLTFDLPDIHDFLNMEGIGSLNQGLVNTGCKLKGKYIDFTNECELNLKDFVTSFAYGEQIDLKTSVTSNNIMINHFELQNESQNLILNRPFEFYNFQNNKFIEDAIELSFKDFDLNNALYYLKDKLDIIQGKLTGNILFTLGKRDFHFQTKSGTYVENFQIVTKNNPEAILQIPKLSFERGRFDIENSDVKIDLLALTGNSEFLVSAAVMNGNFNLFIDKGRFDLADFGKFAGFDIKGTGEVGVQVSSNEKFFNIDIDPQLKNFMFEGYKLNNLDGNIKLDLNRNTLKFKNMKGKYGQTTVAANGDIKLNNLDLNIDVTHDKLHYKDFLGIYNPLFNKLDFLPSEIYGLWQAKMKVRGRATLDDLKIQGEVSGGNTYLYEENIDDFELSFGLENQVLNFSNIILRKGKGRILSAVDINLPKSKVNITGNVQSIPLTEIHNYSKVPLDLSGNLNGYFNLVITESDKEFETQIYLNQTHVSNRPLENSFVDVSYQKNKIRLFANLFGDSFQLASEFNMFESEVSNKKLSNISLNTNVQNLYILLGALKGVDISENNIASDIQITSNVDFNFNSLDKLNALININRLYLSKGNILVDYKSEDGPVILIEDGRINKWDTNIRGNGFYLISKGNGNLNDNYEIGTKVKIDASILEVFNKIISKASGSIVARVDNYKKNEESNYDAVITSNNISLVTDLLPAIITKSDIRISYKNKKLTLDQFEAELSKGKLNLSGNVDLTNVIPQININYNIEEAGITLFNKSNLTLSGKGSLMGTNLPYTLNGEVNVTKCNIVNEITDFGGTEQITKSDLKYLPKNKTFIGNQSLNFNLTVNTREPIRVINSRMDVALEGNVQLIGGEKDPRLQGKIVLAPSNNRIYFQNNEYKLSKGNIYFYESEVISNPELDFLATTNIADHKIDVKVYGPVTDYKVDLSSEPSLVQENILSLMAFGYSEDLSSNLSGEEKESITRAGVGSILFNSFKINETLKNEFGVQVNLGTEISEQAGSYLSHRTTDSGGIGKVRSATTIAIKKKISDAMSMSMTSTVGSNAGQRQSMNLNYNIDDTYSVEGVFEKRSSIEGDQENIGNSFGADLKMKWSFK